ncbi:DUF6468 domain-containing protein [Sneathiella aquimaris]|uniref:DUF6468 domain-containing protein n=1 Tax=Sneathiella aquimaris TaxID=2599305 RepID=UPI00146A60FC|nr:DUF6468 domain-containing protein [Sneathiella aquimaris]
MADIFTIPLFLDLLLVGLLVATIAFCVRLNKKLSVMRDAQSELHKVAMEFDQAIVRSRLGIEELKKASKEAQTELDQELAKAKPLIEELKLINASSSRIADRLQEKVGKVGLASEETKMTSAAVDGIDNSDDPINLEPRTEAERELLQMLTKSR